LKKYNSKIVRLDGKENITLDEHRKIFEYIVANDPEAAAFAMTDHLNRSREIFRTILKSK
jgi:DNA-binding FadR family transcriptional regulator